MAWIFNGVGDHNLMHPTYNRQSSRPYTGYGSADSDSEEVQPANGTDTLTRGNRAHTINASVGFAVLPTPPFQQDQPVNRVAPGPQM
eukprot:712466-Rhodomonas_salina.1